MIKMIRSNTIKSLITRCFQMSATTIRRLKAENSCVQVKRFSLSRTYCNGDKTKESINVRVSSDIPCCVAEMAVLVF